MAAVLVTVALGLAGAAAGDDALPSAPRRWATDSAGFLSEGARQALDGRLEQYERSTGHQILVWITRTSGDFTPEDFASKAFESWRVGRRGIDDGVVLFVFADDRKLRFEVGYGLEATVTDSKSGAILRDTIVPRIQAGDRDGTIAQGIEALIATIDGTASPETASPGDTSNAPSAAQDEPQQGRGHKLSTGEKIVIGLLVIGFIILLITNPSLALWLLFNLLAGGRGGGGGGGGGGGFSGGGGRSGGGGASGSW